MPTRRIHDEAGYAYFVTSTCYKRRRLLDDDMAKRIVIGVLHDQLTRQNGFCSGFVIMPNHVHAIVGFSESDRLGRFMKHWKQRSSYQIKRALTEYLKDYHSQIPQTDPVWQAGYFSFGMYSEEKFLEKLKYMHYNPVKAGLVEKPEDWKYGSARYYVLNKPVGLPIQLPDQRSNR